MILRAEKISKKFNRLTNGASFFYAVEETDFTVAEGALTAVFGKSGSGKTTLLNMLAGLLEPSSGKVFLGETDIYALDDKKLSRLRNEKIGVVPQGATGISALNVLENVLLPVMMYGKRDDESERRAAELLKAVGIEELAGALPNELSGGELRRMAIARALVTKPEIILADEPTGDLDEENTEIILKLLKQTANSGTSVLMVTHEAEAENYADFVYRMNKGEIFNGACKNI